MMKKAIAYIYFSVVLMLLLAICYLSFPRINFGDIKPSGGELINNGNTETNSSTENQNNGNFFSNLFGGKKKKEGKHIDVELSQTVFEYGEGYQMIPIYKYIANEDDFDLCDPDPITISNRDLGVHDITFKLKSKGNREEYTQVVKIEIRDTQPPKIYENKTYNVNNPKSAFTTVNDPVDGIISYKENLSDTDRGYYTVYKTDKEIVCKAIDKNGNVAIKKINIETKKTDESVELNTEVEHIEEEHEKDECVLDIGYDEQYYNFQDEAIAVAQKAFDNYDNEDGEHPKSFSVKAVQCDDYVYYIWDFVW